MRYTFDDNINFDFLDTLLNESLDSYGNWIDNEFNNIISPTSNNSEESEFYELLVDWCDRQRSSTKRKLTDYNEDEIEKFGGNNFFEIQQRSEKINARFNSIQIAYKLFF